MSKNENNRDEVIERLVSYVIQKLPKEEIPLVKRFIRQYYLSVSPEDLTSKSLLDLYAAVLSHWHYIAERKKGQSKVRVYNPNLEQEGWQSAHTIVEISTDDMPFLVDSILMELNRMELNVHLIIHMGSIKLKRNAAGRVFEVLEQDAVGDDFLTEAAIFVEIDRQNSDAECAEIEKNLQAVLKDVRIVVEGWPDMQREAIRIVDEFRQNPPPVEPEMLSEVLAFVEWLADNHFTFMGYQAYVLKGEGRDLAFVPIPDTCHGMVRFNGDNKTILPILDFSQDAQDLIFSSELIMLGKTRYRSTVHRPAYTDFIDIKLFDESGNVIGLKRFVGLYTSVAYNSSPLQIPYLRYKVSLVLKRAGFPPRSHDDRALLNILETLPRDDLFQASIEELTDLVTGILHLQERQKIKLFIRKDVFGNYFSCLIFIPRDSYNSILREKFQDILMKAFKGVEVFFTTRLSESVLARIHFVIRVDKHADESVEYNIQALEQKLIDAARRWIDDLRDALIEHWGDETGLDYFKQYANAFPSSYQESFSARAAVVDIQYFHSLTEHRPLKVSLYKPFEEGEEILKFKLFNLGTTIPLSDVVPILENLGLRIISERPYEINQSKGPVIWINDYRMVHPKGAKIALDEIREIFQDAFDNVWNGKAENDAFNKLVLNAKLNWREISVLRAMTKYLWQAGFTVSQSYVEEVVNINAGISSDLINLFKLKFDPSFQAEKSEIFSLQQKIEKSLDNVSNLTDDRILRRYLELMLSVVRTNYFMKDADGNFREYLSIKIQSSKVPEIPRPIPLYEIYVYAPWVEAIHLRAAKVARGGIRWSERKDDYRTEVLGLMKAQQVKNALIVPMGAKGGFVVKKLREEATREQNMKEIVICYQTMIRGLLDITDNLKETTVIAPEMVVRYDDNDPYLVVAADKGTATFSDLANELSKKYNFWLGDAFASGGSTGYDHKKMGITARGVWESVKRHFFEINMSVEEDFTCIGIGDMSGDVFGNGMLLSRHMKLIAAFNDKHIFIDPNPDPEKSFEERLRLFNLPISSWSDYNPELISPGGGVYSRLIKSISISQEVKNFLQITQDKLQPNDLIRAILKAPVDLLWNGGIGTYVKASNETNSMVGDRSNDALRINGKDLRCKVIGEGGNLGLTQLGRVEFALRGGHLNTDAIDNSGGVNCSDNEVNIKILLNDVVENGDLTEKQRNQLLMSMEDEVATLVLNNNRSQNEAISIMVSKAPENLEMHSRLIQEMERLGNLDPALEFLPDKETIEARKAANLGLTRPEIAILMAYVKIQLKKALIDSDVPEDVFISAALGRAFPKAISREYEHYLNQHRLKREIVSTQVVNSVIDNMGITFISRLQDETGSTSPDIVRAYIASSEIFDAEQTRREINLLAKLIDSKVLLKMIHEVNRLIRRNSRWLLRNKRSGFEVGPMIEHYQEPVREIANIVQELIVGLGYGAEALIQELREANVPEILALKIGSLSAMFSALDIVEAASKFNYSIECVTKIYFAVGQRLQLDWFRELIKKRPVGSHWESLARATFRDDLDRQQRNITVAILEGNEIMGDPDKDATNLIDAWLKRHSNLVKRWEFFVSELKMAQDPNFTMFSVALRELLDMSLTNQRKNKKNG